MAPADAATANDHPSHAMKKNKEGRLEGPAPWSYGSGRHHRLPASDPGGLRPKESRAASVLPAGDPEKGAVGAESRRYGQNRLCHGEVWPEISGRRGAYGKYISGWGDESIVWRLDAEKDGKVAASVTCGPSAKLHLEVKPSHTQLTEGDTYDMAAVRIRILDEHGNSASFAQLRVRFRLEGAAELVGPEVVTAEGGMTDTYGKTTGKSGEAKRTITTSQTNPVTVTVE